MPSAKLAVPLHALLALLMLAACDSTPTESPTIRVEGRYVLESIGAQRLPVVFRSINGPARRLYVWTDTLTLAAGTMTQSYVYRDSLPSAGTFTEQRETSSNPYRSNRDTVFFVFSAVHVDTAFATPSGIRNPVVDSSLTFCSVPRCEFFFRRLP